FKKGSGGIERRASQVLQEAGFPRLETPATIPWRGTPALTRVTGAVSAHRAFVIGDAAGYVEPFTGEGMKWAVTSGIAVAPIVARAIDSYEKNLGLQWSDVHRRLISERTGACKMLSRALRRPNLVSMAIRCVSALPILASPFVRHLNQHDSIQKEVRL
ncbi:MAG TPA: NAD-binding protein, partial [Candidatus Hydrogenedentes bacterium]|nr:NAD-binding protein [Candidatus Hydrogenedentota bacterium]